MREAVYTCDMCEKAKTRVPWPSRTIPKDWSLVEIVVEIGGTQATVDLHLDVCPKCILDAKRVGGIAKIVRARLDAVPKCC